MPVPRVRPRARPPLARVAGCGLDRHHGLRGQRQVPPSPLARYRAGNQAVHLDGLYYDADWKPLDKDTLIADHARDAQVIILRSRRAARQAHRHPRHDPRPRQPSCPR